MRRKNPYDYLVPTVHLRTVTEHRRPRARPAIRPGAEAREAAFEHYDDLVDNELEMLRVRAYETCYPTRRMQGETYWRIVEWGDEGESREPFVHVTLEFDADGKPVAFLCRAQGRTVRASLTEEGLTRALQELHPAIGS